MHIPHFRGSFTPEQYLEQRQSQADLHVVELGHGRSPITLVDTSFTGERCYTGVEAWLRSSSNIVRQTLHDQNENQIDQNIEFEDYDVGGKIVCDTDEVGDQKRYEGIYLPRAPLPDDVADEVVVANVFGDEQVSKMADGTDALLEEIARLLKPTGTAVIRETISPKYCKINESRLAASGLLRQSRIRSRHKAWNQLEAIYNGSFILGNRGWLSPSFYLFLSKAN